MLWFTYVCLQESEQEFSQLEQEQVSAAEASVSVHDYLQHFHV